MERLWSGPVRGEGQRSLPWWDLKGKTSIEEVEMGGEDYLGKDGEIGIK